MDHIQPAPFLRLALISLFGRRPLEPPLVEDFLRGLVNEEVFPDKTESAVVLEPGLPHLTKGLLSLHDSAGPIFEKDFFVEQVHDSFQIVAVPGLIPLAQSIFDFLFRQHPFPPLSQANPGWLG